MKNLTRTIGLLLLPVGLLIVNYVLLFNINLVSKQWIVVLRYSSYFLFIVGMLLGARFNRSKVFFLCLILGTSQFILSYDIPQVYKVISVLIPINILIFAILKERGILTLWGNVRTALILGQVFMGWRVIQPENEDLFMFINKEYTNWKYINISSLPQLSLILFLIVFFVFFIKICIKSAFADSVLMGVLLTAFNGLYLRDQDMALPICFAMAGLILIILIIQSSYFMAYLDELTGIPARRALRESMMKLAGKYVIVMSDIDFFKKFNDKYGHDTGDEVLKLVANQLKKVTGGGRAYRYGGEEFTILFPNKTIDQVIPHLEELREKISKQGYAYTKKGKYKGKEKITTKELFVTVSLGVAEKNEKYKSPDEVLKAADNALYRAKKKGRNCVSK